MENVTRIEELKVNVISANTANADGRHVIVNACKELFDIIEDSLYNNYGEGAVQDAYTDLCNGNFAEPFKCEQKKSKFELYATIYTKNILK